MSPPVPCLGPLLCRKDSSQMANQGQNIMAYNMLRVCLCVCLLYFTCANTRGTSAVEVTITAGSPGKKLLGSRTGNIVCYLYCPNLPTFSLLHPPPLPPPSLLPADHNQNGMQISRAPEHPCTHRVPALQSNGAWSIATWRVFI